MKFNLLFKSMHMQTYFKSFYCFNIHFSFSLFSPFLSIFFHSFSSSSRLTEVYGSNEHTSGYAWCPNTHVEDGLREWIQAEFSHLVIISVIFTAGRGDGNVSCFFLHSFPFSVLVFLVVIRKLHDF